MNSAPHASNASNEDVPLQLSQVLYAIATEQGGFLTPEQVADIAKRDRLRQVLVRCGGFRLLCPAQDVAAILECIEAHPTHYVRDVSLPSSDPIWRSVRGSVQS